MLGEKEVFKGLEELSDVFKQHVRYKQWEQAKYCYEKATNVAVFLRLEEKKMRELFGERGDRGEVISEGLFPEEMVQKVYLECSVKRKQEFEARQYRPLQKNGV